MTHQEKIQELLEQRSTLFEIAEVLYGDAFVLEEEFWGSPTEVELSQTHALLSDLGYEFEIDTETLDAAKVIGKEMGLLPDEDEEE
jgi:hypothetical protein